MHIGLVSCTCQKLPGAHMARDLYVGNSFKSARAIVEEICDEWFILSAQYGFLLPERYVSSYDKSLRDMPTAEYMSWCQGIAAAVTEMLPTKVTIIARPEYVGYLHPILRSRDIEVDRRPRVDIHGYGPGRWYMSCAQCGNSGAFVMDYKQAVDQAINHPCRVKEK